MQLQRKAELKSLIEADRLDLDLKYSATQDCMCLTLEGRPVFTNEMNE